jgi:hypothetical protein
VPQEIMGEFNQPKELKDVEIRVMITVRVSSRFHESSSRSIDQAKSNTLDYRHKMGEIPSVAREVKVPKANQQCQER